MATKAAAGIDKQQTMKFLSHFFETFQKCCNQQGSVNASVLEPFLAKNFTLTANDFVASRSLSDYMNRIAQFQKKFSHVEVSGPTPDFCVFGNKFCVQYTIDFTLRNGHKNEVLVMALGTMEDNKISSWKQITHEKGSGLHWES